MASTRVRSLLRSSSNPIPSTMAAEQAAAEAQPPATSAPPPAPISYSRLIARQDWDSLLSGLGTDEGRIHARCEMESSPDVDGGALHFACRFHPPLDVIMSLAEVCPGSVEKADNMGRYPLHIAAKWGASPRVVKFLLQVYPDAAGLQDAMGKTPLHLCCESYASKYSSRKAEGQPLKDAMVEVVRRLCRAAPDAVNLEDMEDMTALEYAIEADVELKVVRSIQKACEKDWKHRRELPGASHETVQRSLLQQAQQNSQRLLLEQQQKVLQASSRNLQMDLKDVTAAAMSMSISNLGGEEGKKLGTRQPVPLQHAPRKKPSTRALMA